MKQCQIVSAPFASGVTWLVNVLLELGIRTTHLAPDYRATHWLPSSRGVQIGEKAREHLRWHLPILLERQEFLFEPDLEVFWEHRLDLARHLDRPTILFVRDPRDAIYSLYRRDYAAGQTFHDFLSQPRTWPYHFPGMFRLPPAETWSYYHLFWLGLRKSMNLKVVTFEEMRAQPIEVTEQLLGFLGVSRPREEIQLALDRSTFERARQATEKLERETGRNWTTARKGKVAEWKDTFDEPALSHFSGPVGSTMELMGYLPAEASEGDSTPTSVDLLLNDVDPSVAGLLDEALGLYREGHTTTARHMLVQAFNMCCDQPASVLAVANAITSLVWTNYVFSEELVTSSIGQAVFGTFYETNARFITLPSVRQAILQTTVLHHPGHQTSPMLVEHSYKGFNFAAWHDQYYAVAQSLSLTDLAKLDGTALLQYQENGLLFSGRSLAEVVEMVDQGGTAANWGPPQLIEGDYHRFNIVSYRGKYHGVAQNLGPIDLVRVTPQLLDQHQKCGKWVVADSLPEAKRLIDGLSAASRFEQRTASIAIPRHARRAPYGS